MPFNEQLFNWHTAMPPVARIIPVTHKTTCPGNLRAIFHSNLHANSQLAPHLTPHLAHQISPLTTNASRTREKYSCRQEKYSRTPAYLCITTICHSILSTVRRRPLFLASCDARPCYRRYIAPPHLTENVPGERPEAHIQSSDHGKTKSNEEGSRVG